MAAALAAKPARDEKYWATILILLPLVFQRLFIGGTSGGYENYTGMSFAWIGYAVHGLFVFQFLTSRSVEDRLRILVPVLVLVVVSIPQLLVTTGLFEISLFELIIPLGRAILWIMAIYIYVERYFEAESFKRAFIELIAVAGAFILFCALFNLVTGIPLGVNIEKGLPRPHGTFSEPSTLGSVFPGFTVLAVLNRRFVLAAMGLAVIALSASVISTGAFAVVLFIYLFGRLRTVTSTITYFVVSAAVFMTLALSPLIVSALSSGTASISGFLDGVIGQSDLRAYTIDRLLTAINDLAFYLNSGSILEVEESGSLARFVGAMTMLDNMNTDGTTWFGYGLSVYGYVANQVYDTVLDFGLYPYLISGFGILVGSIGIYVIAARVLRWRYVDTGVFLIFVGSLIGTIYNSGGGIIAYSMPLMTLLIPTSRFPIDKSGDRRHPRP